MESKEKHHWCFAGSFERTVLPIGLFGFLLVLFVSFLLRIGDRGTLVGVQLMTMPEFTLSGFVDGSYQSNWGKWLNDNFCGHTFVVKCHNQLQYSVFKDGNGDWGLGKDYMIFSRGNAMNYTMGERSWIADQAAFDEYAESVYSLQEKLREQGKDFIYLLTPMKVEIYADQLSWNYRLVAGKYLGKRENNRDRLIAAFMKYGVNYYDMTDDFVQMRAEADYEVFPKTGHHWSLTAVAYEMNTLFEKISPMTPNIHYPCVDVISLRDEVYFTDVDIYNSENIFKGVLCDRYTYPDIQYTQKSDANVYIFGTSMSCGVMDALAVDEQNQAFNELVYQSYFTYKVIADENGKSVQTYQESDSPDTLQIMEHIQNSNLIIMESPAIAGIMETHTKFLNYLNQN